MYRSDDLNWIFQNNNIFKNALNNLFNKGQGVLNFKGCMVSKNRNLRGKGELFELRVNFKTDNYI